MSLFHKILISLTLLLLGASLISFRSDSEDLFWYVEGEPYFWEAQPDVYAYRVHQSNAEKLNLDESLVDRVQYRSADDKIRLVYFNEGTSEFDKQSVISQIENSYEFDVSFPVITLFPNLVYSKGMWFVTDDRLMVNFKSQELDSNSIQNFEIKYNLLALNRPPSNSSSSNFTYIFKIDPTELVYTNSISLAKSIYVEESQIIENIQPNLINAYEEQGEVEVINSVGDELINAPSITNTFYIANLSNDQVKVFTSFPNLEESLSFNVYDLTGKKLFTKALNSNQLDFIINLSAYPTGMYIANVEKNTGEAVGQYRFRKF